jgi:hypothetical protein
MLVNIRKTDINRGFTFTVHVSALMLRAVQAIHLAVRAIRASTKTKTVARAVMVIQSRRSTAVCVSIITTTI